MFGFVVGTLSLVGLIKVWRWGRRGHRGGPRRWMVRRLFEELDTTPGQEKVIEAAVDDVERKLRAAREGMWASRTSVAQSMRGEHFDTAGVNEAFDAQQRRIDEARRAVIDGLRAVHEALRPEQRARLADLVEWGPRRGRACHAHHSHRGHHGGEPSPVSL